jgi:N utilization substance protein B
MVFSHNSDTDEDSLPKRHKSVRRRTACRLAAVQTLFQSYASVTPVDQTVPRFKTHFLPKLLAEFDIKSIDDAHYTRLVFGAAHFADDIDQMIKPLLRNDWTIERLGEVERAVIRIAFIELRDAAEIPAKSTVTEYTAIADGCGGDSNFINAILDKLARYHRPDEME